MRLIQPTGEVLTIRRFESGELVSGECTRFIKTFANGVILTNNARFGIQGRAFVLAPPPVPGTGPQRSLFVPPKNVMTIAADKFAEGKGRTVVQNIGTAVLWSGSKGSAIGTLRCAPLERYPCMLGKLILSSPYRIHEFGFVPAPDAGSSAGKIWMWITIAPDREALVSYDTLSN